MAAGDGQCPVWQPCRTLPKVAGPVFLEAMMCRSLLLMGRIMCEGR